MAQGILESGAGKSMLTRKANNHFGVKAFGGWTGPVYLAWDDEKQKSRFRSYSSAMESYRDHSLFLKNNSRYSSLFSKSVYLLPQCDSIAQRFLVTFLLKKVTYQIRSNCIFSVRREHPTHTYCRKSP